MPIHKVKDGDCVSSIAASSGHLWETLWDHSKNATLKQTRSDPNTLLPNDRLFVPQLKIEPIAAAADSKHSYIKKGVLAKIKLRILINDEPRKNTQYRLYIDHELINESASDGDGYIEEVIKSAAKFGKLVIVDVDGNQEIYPFKLGTVYPIDTEEGVKKRLFNLGFGTMDLATALGEFQNKHSLVESKTIDDATKNKLKEVFGQ